MKQGIYIIGCLLGLLTCNPQYAQVKPAVELSAEEIKAYKEKVRDLVNYLENTLNFIGDPDAVSREKEIAINESYLKVFRDDKVQIEDDLDENREVPLYKDVQAYLKDIRFFFRKAEFKFHITGIDHFVNENNKHFFKVTFNRDLKAVTVSGDTVDSRKIRYMEVNLDPEKNDLKIASIYTTKLNEREEVRLWWNALNPAWRNIFGKGLTIYDTIELQDIAYIGDSSIVIKEIPEESPPGNEVYDLMLKEDRRIFGNDSTGDTLRVDTRELYKRLNTILKQKEMDISDNESVKSLQPLSELSELTFINCSGTTVIDLLPVRNLIKLEILDFSNTPVEDLSPIQYSTSIKELSCSYTLVFSPEPISGLYNLEKLECAGLRIDDLSFLAGLKNMTDLDCSETQIHNAEPLRHLSQIRDLDISGTLVSSLAFAEDLLYLTHLNCENTPVSDLEPLKNLEQLEILKISNTSVESLEPLESLENLKRIYWDSDNSMLINKKQRKERAISFMDSHPGTLVIFETDELAREWQNMETRWKGAIREATGLSENPSKEDLHKVLRIESLSLTGGHVESLDPLLKLYNLKQLDISGLKTDNYSPAGELIELEELNISNTGVDNLDFVSNLYNLKILRAEHTGVSSLQPLESLVNLEYVYVDDTRVNDEDASQLRERSPECLIIYKSNVLMEWWQALNTHWKEFFTSKFLLNAPPTKEQLHMLLYLKSLEITGKSNIGSLNALAMLTNLEVLKLDGLQISDLQSITQLRNLKELQIIQMPVSDLSFVTGHINLELLNVENTRVDDLKPLSYLHKLKKLNLSGTQVKSLRPLSDLDQLEDLSLNNTRVRNLKPVMDIGSLKALQCYNTRISEKSVEKFKEANPDCRVVYY